MFLILILINMTYFNRTVEVFGLQAKLNLSFDFKIRLKTKDSCPKTGG